MGAIASGGVAVVNDRWSEGRPSRMRPSSGRPSRRAGNCCAVSRRTARAGLSRTLQARSRLLSMMGWLRVRACEPDGSAPESAARTRRCRCASGHSRRAKSWLAALADEVLCATTLSPFLAIGADDWDGPAQRNPPPRRSPHARCAHQRRCRPAAPICRHDRHCHLAGCPPAGGRARGHDGHRMSGRPGRRLLNRLAAVRRANQPQGCGSIP
jgi:hypothetical protein